MIPVAPVIGTSFGVLVVVILGYEASGMMEETWE